MTFSRTCNTACCNYRKDFIQNSIATISDIYDVFLSKIMNKNKVILDKPSTMDAERTELIMVRVTPSEKEFFESLTTILSKLDVDGKGTKVIKNNSLSDFVRMSLSLASNFYSSNIFPNSSVSHLYK